MVTPSRSAHSGAVERGCEGAKEGGREGGAGFTENEARQAFPPLHPSLSLPPSLPPSSLPSSFSPTRLLVSLPPYCRARASPTHVNMSINITARGEPA